MLGLSEALERLASPFAREELSPLGGAPLLAVDLGRDAGRPASWLAAREMLARLPCPSAAIRAAAPSALARRLEPAFDVLVESADELEPLRRAVTAAPLASAALVELLRHAEHLDAQAGLLAESWVYSLLQSGPEFAAWLAARPRPAPAPAADGPAVLCRREGDALWLTLNRPARHNAYSAGMRDELLEGLRVAAADPSIREVRLSGAGDSFCSGGELSEFGSLPDPATAHAVRQARSAARLLAACSHRVRADVHGACIGAGVELAAFAGRVCARPNAFFCLPEVGMGLVPGAGGTVSIPRRIGRQRTAWLALSGERIDAALAWRWGLVDELSV